MVTAALVLKVLGVLVGSTLFAVGIAGGNGAAFFFGTLLVVLSLLLGPRSASEAVEHH